MSERIPHLLIRDMLGAINSILEYTSGIEAEVFYSDKKTEDAVMRNLGILGETVSRLPINVKSENPQIEWSRVIRSRHILIHGYGKVDDEVVWRIITTYIPPLKESLEALLSKL